jgi:hypothetical protein
MKSWPTHVGHLVERLFKVCTTLISSSFSLLPVSLKPRALCIHFFFTLHGFIMNHKERWLVISWRGRNFHWLHGKALYNWLRGKVEKWWCFPLVWKRMNILFFGILYTTHTHTHTHIYIYRFQSLCVCIYTQGNRGRPHCWPIYIYIYIEKFILYFFRN